MANAASERTPPPTSDRDDLLTREVLRGLELMSPRPSLHHADCAGQLLIVLGGHFGRRRRPGGPGRSSGGWSILHEPELHLEGEDPIVPDIAGWRAERMPLLPRASATKLAPDWVCEVLSPSTEKLDRSLKMEIYAAARVGHLWLVDPLRRKLEVYELAKERYQQKAAHAGEQAIQAVPFESLTLELSEIWPAG